VVQKFYKPTNAHTYLFFCGEMLGTGRGLNKVVRVSTKIKGKGKVYVENYITKIFMLIVTAVAIGWVREERS
jgi:hypothetical protein